MVNQGWGMSATTLESECMFFFFFWTLDFKSLCLQCLFSDQTLYGHYNNAKMNNDSLGGAHVTAYVLGLGWAALLDEATVCSQLVDW